MNSKFTIIGLLSITLLLISCSPDELQTENQQQTEFSLSADDPNGNTIGDGSGEGNPLNPKDKE